ncbi:hypothetical protein N7G274_007580 [Stereocaulon virgatum]|uniref:Uncharacterized protein n=1 Tax=Stereocaulon virgatum TaxID=373712 RepID=A0ABR4A435_9LECA
MSENTKCFYPDGKPSIDTPCGKFNMSTCCGPGWDCLANGLCLLHGSATNFSTGSCTNLNWQNCQDFCYQNAYQGFGNVNHCLPHGNSWCCAGEQGWGGRPNCCDTNATTSLENRPLQTGASITLGSSTAALISPPSVVATSSSTFFTSSPTTSEAAISQNVVTPSQILVTPSQIPVTAPSNSASPQPTIQKINSKIKVGIGVPVALVLVLLAILTFLVFQNRRQKRRLLQLQSLRVDVPLRHKEIDHGLQELDITHYELAHPNAPQHEIAGNGIYESGQSRLRVH